MQSCGLGSKDFKTYVAACLAPHTTIVEVDLLTNEGDLVVSFDSGRAGGRNVTVTDGSIAVDTGTASRRALDLAVFDPDRLLVVSEAANYTDRMLSVKVGVPVPALGAGTVVWANPFVGPIVSAPRDGNDVVQFSAQGKARFGQHGVRTRYIIKKGTKKTDAIKQLMHELAGEPLARMGRVPDLPSKLAQDLALGLNQRPWGSSLQLAGALGRDLHYSGGDLVMPLLDAPALDIAVFVQQPGQPTALLTEPTVQTDWSGIKNAVEITGGATKTDPAPVGYAFADPSNPFSAETQGRFGTLAEYWDQQTITTVHTQATADRIAAATLARDLAAVSLVKFDAMPLYFFDDNDPVMVQTEAMPPRLVRMAQFTMPLNLDSAPPMSVGYNRRVSSDVFWRQR